MQTLIWRIWRILSMKNAKRIGGVGQWIMVVGSALYVASLLTEETTLSILAISCIYIVAVVLMLIGWFGTKDERKAQKAAKKAEKQAQKA